MAVQKKRRDLLCLVCLALAVGHLALSNAATWWSLGLQECAANFNECKTCAGTNLFSPQQQKVCSANGEKELVKAISKGALECIRDCQKQFSDSQWNCTTFQGEHLFGSFVENGTRETAMVNAFLSAGAAHGIASACHESVLEGCTCDADPARREGDVTYLQSCGDDVNYAIRLLRELYGLEGSTRERDLVDSWNNELGYAAVDNRTTYCRCTGLSGSCVVQTCYKKAPSIDEIGSKLQPRYEGSQKVYGNNGSLFIEGTDHRNPIHNFPCYINDTPDLCRRSPEEGILGTSGRKCDPSSGGANGCNSLCCNGYHQVTYEVQREKCKFVWCCRIECTPGEIEEVVEYRCT